MGGAGHIGSYITRGLREVGDNWEIIVADINLDAAKGLVDEIGGPSKALRIDAGDIDDMAHAFKGMDLVVGSVGPFYKYGPSMLEAAIKAGVNYMDINDDYDATIKCLDMHEKAVEKDVLAVIGLGFTPGVTNVIAKLASNEMDKVDDIKTSWAWTAIDPTEGPGIIAHYFHASTGLVPTFKNGELVEVPALSEPEEISIHKLGRFIVSHVGHPEPITIPRYIEGVKNVSNKGTVWPEYMAQAAKLFSELGLTSMNKLSIGGSDIPARDIAVRLVMALPEIAPEETLERIFEDAQERYGDYAIFGAGLNVKVYGYIDGRRALHEYSVVTESAAKATADPLVIGVKQFAEGLIDMKGVYAPEAVVIPDKFLRDVSDAMEIVYSKTTMGRL